MPGLHRGSSGCSSPVVPPPSRGPQGDQKVPETSHDLIPGCPASSVHRWFSPGAQEQRHSSQASPSSVHAWTPESPSSQVQDLVVLGWQTSTPPGWPISPTHPVASALASSVNLARLTPHRALQTVARSAASLMLLTQTRRMSSATSVPTRKEGVFFATKPSARRSLPTNSRSRPLPCRPGGRSRRTSQGVLENTECSTAWTSCPQRREPHPACSRSLASNVDGVRKLLSTDSVRAATAR
jgi:hypothetical protein